MHDRFEDWILSNTDLTYDEWLTSNATFFAECARLAADTRVWLREQKLRIQVEAPYRSEGVTVGPLKFRSSTENVFRTHDGEYLNRAQLKARFGYDDPLFLRGHGFIK